MQITIHKTLFYSSTVSNSVITENPKFMKKRMDKLWYGSKLRNYLEIRMDQGRAQAGSRDLLRNLNVLILDLGGSYMDVHFVNIH